MNKRAVKAAIRIMERAGPVDMRSYQNCLPDRAVKTETALHKCGNTACFAGWVAVSPEWRRHKDRTIGANGSPVYDGWFGTFAIQHWLGISKSTAWGLVHGDCVFEWSRFYGKPWSEVGASDVIAKLQLILNGELK